MIRLYGGKLTRIRRLAETLLLVSPRALASHCSSIMLGCAADTVSEGMVLDGHRVPSDWERELCGAVPYCCGLDGKRAVILSS